MAYCGWFGGNNAAATISSVTDSTGNTYQVAAGLARGSSLSQAIYYASDIVAASAGTNAVTVSFNHAVPFADLRIVEYSNLATANPLDTSASAAGSGATANSGNLTTSAAGELLVGPGPPRAPLAERGRATPAGSSPTRMGTSSRTRWRAVVDPTMPPPRSMGTG